MSPQILITGATGFIGRRLTRDLAVAGENVRVFARDPRRAQRLFGSTVEIAAGDLADGAALRRACEGVGIIYHIAGSYRFGLKHRRVIWRDNVEGTVNLLHAAEQAGAARLVHLSSAGVLRAPEGGARLLTEDDFPASPPRFSPYKASKWEAERQVLAAAGRGFPAIIASTTCPIGSGDATPTPTGQMVRDFLTRRFPFHCRAGLNFIAVGDLSQGLQRIAERGQPGHRYLLADENLWLKEFLELLARETGLPAPRYGLPGWAVRAIGGAGEVLDWLNAGSRGARVCLETSLQTGHVQFFSNARAREELGWVPQIPLRQSMRESIAWFRGEPEAAPVPLAALESHAR